MRVTVYRPSDATDPNGRTDVFGDPFEMSLDPETKAYKIRYANSSGYWIKEYHHSEWLHIDIDGQAPTNYDQPGAAPGR
jgi:hypothetical protein